MFQQRLGLATGVVVIFFTSLTAESHTLINHPEQQQSLWDVFIKPLWYRFYEVTPNKFYRSSQMPTDILKKYIQLYGIKTIINLRGRDKNAAWWVHEKKVADECGIAYYNIAMSAKTLPSKKNLNKLLDIYSSAQLPILVHCEGGADRSGEAAALWLLDQEHATTKKALNQLSLKYWHISALYPAKRFFIKLWQGRGWARYIYDPDCYQDCNE